MVLYFNCSFIRFKIRIGDVNHNSSRVDVNLRVLPILKSSVHPKFDGNSPYFDVAILEAEKISFSRFISPVCLPEDVSYNLKKYDNHHVDLIGWGSSTTRCQFHQHFTRSFYTCRSKKHKKTVKSSNFLRSQDLCA